MKTSITQQSLSRGRFLGMTAASVAAPVLGTALAHADQPSGVDLAAGSGALAFGSLGASMDLYAGGATPRLAQSYKPTPTFSLGDRGFVYDNAVAIIAFLGRGTVDDVARARALGDGLLLVQATDSSAPDGRVRDWYHTATFAAPAGAGYASGFGAVGSATGTIAWAGLTLAQLFSHTRDARYLAGAVALGTWAETRTRDTRGAGGYTAGIRADGSWGQYKATEHNIDLYALFTALGTLTRDHAWTERAGHALSLVQAMWDAAAGHFWTGTGNDGVAVNRDVVPEDVQAWSWLALRNRSYAGALDWAARSLAAAGAYGGVSFSDADRSATWCEGTAHLAAALLDRNRAGDMLAAGTYLAGLQRAQSSAPNADGAGIVAATRDGLATGFGDDYYASVHVGATAWSLLASARGNPFRV